MNNMEHPKLNPKHQQLQLGELNPHSSKIKYLKENGQKPKSFLCWYGGKFFQRKWIISHFPEHTCYVEVFGGAGHVLFTKDPSPNEVFNDIYSELINFYRVAVAMPDKLFSLISGTLHSREEFNRCKSILESNESDPLIRAWAFIVVNRQSFGGMVKTGDCVWGYNRTPNPRFQSPKDPNKFKAFIDRLKKVQIENDSFEKIIPRYDSPNTLFYLDPPYIHEQRCVRKAYQHEFTNQDHSNLVNLILSSKGKFIISGYNNNLYLPLEQNGYVRIEKKIYTYSSNMAKPPSPTRPTRTDCIWIKNLK